MPFLCPAFHQSMFAVFAVQCECLPNDERCTACPDEQADVRVYTCHVHNHDEDKHTEQASGEDAQVLCFQSFELDRPTDTIIDIVIDHRSSAYRKNERRMRAATIRKIHAPSHDAAVFLVAGAPL